MDKGKGKATPLADNVNRIKGAKDVLIHPVEKHDTIAGIALSYGISVSSSGSLNFPPCLKNLSKLVTPIFEALH